MKHCYLLVICFAYYVTCTNIDGYDGNFLDFSPIYEAVILNDMVDVFKDFDNNLNPQFDTHYLNSESDESIADLLFEYQHYLDKAHNQHINYLEKTKAKNKIPLLRHDKYAKRKFGSDKSYNEPNNLYSNSFKYSQNAFGQIDAWPQTKNNLNFLYNPDARQIQQHSEVSEPSISTKVLGLPPVLSKPIYSEIFSSCYCKDNKIPCKCDCKQCLVAVGPITGNNLKQQKFVTYPNIYSDNSHESQRFSAEEKFRDVLDNKLNIRIKVDVQLPKIFDLLQKSLKNRSQDLEGLEEGSSKESVSSTVNVPFPYLNFPVPLDIFSFKKPFMYKNYLEPTHKITIHRKRKSRVNNGKRHKNKKLFTFKLDSLLPKNVILENFTVSENCKNASMNTMCDMERHNFSNISTKNVTGLTNFSLEFNPENDLKARLKSLTNLKVNNSIETIYLTVNISDNSNKTDDIQKMENSIETEINTSDKITTLAPSVLRLKRDVLITNQNVTTIKIKKHWNGSISNETAKVKKIKKVLVDEDELLYWPISTNNTPSTTSKNITTLILERENTKAKLNISYDIIRKNHTNALEQAIFGDINWDDVDTVVPVFISFVGKYIRGILSFCSQTMCHSMKCVKKLCLHRVCEPENRFNHKGHCIGNNNTDSVAALESIMDLPSNIALEIVDILEDKLLGKMFGKATLCITSKCVTFIASKKTFIKSKCMIKELSPTGHCSNINDSKIM